MSHEGQLSHFVPNHALSVFLNGTSCSLLYLGLYDKPACIAIRSLQLKVRQQFTGCTCDRRWHGSGCVCTREQDYSKHLYSVKCERGRVMTLRSISEITPRWRPHFQWLYAEWEPFILAEDDARFCCGSSPFDESGKINNNSNTSNTFSTLHSFIPPWLNVTQENCHWCPLPSSVLNMFFCKHYVFIAHDKP